MCAASVILLTVLAQTQSLTADPQAKTQAQTLLGQGTALYQQGNIASALEKFEAAYMAFPSPKLMFNIGRANRDLGRPVEAIEAFQRFIAEAADASPETMADARTSVADLKKKLGRIQIDCTMPGAEIAVDGKTVGLTPLPGLVWATQGRHQITASHARAVPTIESVEVTAGSVSKVAVRLVPLTTPMAAVPVPTAEPVPAPAFVSEPVSEPAPAAAPAPAAEPALAIEPAPFTAPPPKLNVQAPPPSDAHEGWWLGRKWTWVAAGSTVLLATGAIAAGVSMQNRFNSLRSSCGAASGNTPNCSQSDVDSVNSRKSAANVLWGLTGAAAVATGALFYFEGQPVTVAPMAGGVTGVLATVEF